MNILYNFLFSVDLAKRGKNPMWSVIFISQTHTNDLSDCASPVLKLPGCSLSGNKVYVEKQETVLFYSSVHSLLSDFEEQS